MPLTFDTDNTAPLFFVAACSNLTILHKIADLFVSSAKMESWQETWEYRNTDNLWHVTIQPR